MKRQASSDARTGTLGAIAFGVALAAGVAAIAAYLFGYVRAVPPLVILGLAGTATGFGRHRVLRGFAFTAWVFVFVAASMFYPGAFMTWAGWDLGVLIVPLIQVIMFGMGTTLSVRDFARVFKMPWAVFVGFALQFTVMPLVGFGLAHAFGFEGAIAAGVVLIGCCPSGVASNVMAYLGRGDVALSVTVTSFTTLASPVMTPFLMRTLGGEFVQIDFLKMMIEIVNMIIVPIVAGLLAHRILYSPQPAFRRAGVLGAIAGVGIVVGAMIAAWLPASLLTVGSASLKNGLVVGLLLLGVVALAKWLISVAWKGPPDWMDRALPVLSMTAICFIIAIITARSRRDLLSVGPLLIASSMIHNAAGYLLGYTLARAARLNERACRTVAFEVGMQNGGMASALAMNVLKSPPAALAAAIFGPWQNVSGSILASWWHRRPPAEAASTVPETRKIESETSYEPTPRS